MWRWHFYAGMFCIPFVLILSITGTIYLFKPQLVAGRESQIDQQVTSGTSHPVHHQIAAAVASLPGGQFESLQLSPQANGTATRVMVAHDGSSRCVYVDPASLAILATTDEKTGIEEVAKTIHGELLLGKRGSYLVELAACWTIVMVLTGLALWWPKNSRWGAGVLYPRLGIQGRLWWRDVHSVGGVWASALILFLILTGLPWATFWGDYFKSMRRWTGTAVVKQDWSSGSESNSPLSKQTVHASMKPAGDEHTEHAEHASHVPSSKAAGSKRPSWRKSAVDPNSYDVTEIDRVLPAAYELGLEAPVLVRPLANQPHRWEIESTTANRPQRATFVFDVTTSKLEQTARFADRHWLDRLVGQGIALHEGQRFGWPNQLLALFATTALVLLSVSGLAMWWRRGRQIPKQSRRERSEFRLTSQRAIPLLAGITLLGIALPLFGLSLLGIVTIDQLRQRFVRVAWNW